MAFLFNRSNKEKKSSGLPWLELTIVFVVLVGLAAMATPNFRRCRERSNQRASYANQKTVAGAIEMYNLDNNVKVNQLTPEVWQNLRSQGYLQTIPDDPGYGQGSHLNYRLDKNGDVYSTKYGGIQKNPNSQDKHVVAQAIVVDHAARALEAARRQAAAKRLASKKARLAKLARNKHAKRKHAQAMLAKASKAKATHKVVTKVIKEKRTSWLGPVLVSERKEITSVPIKREPIRLAVSARPFKRTIIEPFSTFAVDVDTASYTQMRQSVLNGRLPAKSRVRPEEFVNFFDHEYAAPQHDVFAVHATSAPSPYRPGVVLMEVGLKAREVKSEDRLPASITVVVDTSGSMSSGRRLQKVKESLRLLVNELKEGDTVAIVEYSTWALTVLPATLVSRKQTIINAINRLRTHGGTNVYKGLELGYELARKSYAEERINRVIICSDGMANSGHRHAESILDEIGEDARRGIYLTCVGVGMGHNDKLMEKLANKGNGTCSYIDTVEEARRIFCKELTSTLQTVARDAKIQMEFDKKLVAGHRLVGYKNRLMATKDFRNDKKDAGEVGAGHSVTAVYELQLNKPMDKLAGSFDRLATLRVRFKDPVRNKVTEYQEEITAGSFHRDFYEAPARFRLSAAVVRFAEVLRDRQLEDKATAKVLCEEAELLSSELAADKDIKEFAQIVSKASYLLFGKAVVPGSEYARASD